MYDLISLNVRCPVCSKSLMDEEVLVDNSSSIKLKTEIRNKKGLIRLSSVYDSYNFVSEIPTPKNEIAFFFCPHCNSEITSNLECDLCQAVMIPLELDLRGKVSFCSRVGCKNHSVWFVDFSFALKKLYHGSGFREKVDESLNEEDRIVKSGSFLNAFCPHCNKTLISDGVLKLKIVQENKKSGFLILSPYLNIFTSRSTLFLKEGKLVGDIRCFNCDTSLMEEEEECGECESSVAKIALNVRNKMLDFYICSKKGCRWHGLNQEDINEIRLEDSMEW